MASLSKSLAHARSLWIDPGRRCGSAGQRILLAVGVLEMVLLLVLAWGAVSVGLAGV